jgi:hypothetical protein
LAGRVGVDVCNAVTPLLRLRYHQVRDDVLEEIMRRMDRIEAQAARPVPMLTTGGH